MRIAITGSHGVGKTTLAKAVGAALDLPVLPEASRIAAEALELGPLGEKHVGGGFQEACLDIQQRNEEAYENFVADRGWPDYVAYPLAIGSFSSKSIGRYVGRVQSVAYRAYDLVVFVPIEFPLKGDGFRSTDIAYQASIDTLLRVLIPGICAGTPLLKVHGSLEERRDAVVQKVKFVEGSP